MLCIDKGGDAASLLRLCNSVNGECSLTRRLRTINLYNTSLGVSAHAECGVKANTSGRNHLDILHLLVTKLHDGAFAEVLFYL